MYEDTQILIHCKCTCKILHVFGNTVTDTTKLCNPLKKAVVKNMPICISIEVLITARKKCNCWCRYKYNVSVLWLFCKHSKNFCREM